MRLGPWQRCSYFSFNFLASLINGNAERSMWIAGKPAFNFLASLINGNISSGAG